MNKSKQRESIKSRLSEMTVDERKLLSHAASLNLIVMHEFRRAKRILVYHALPSECDPSYIASVAMSENKLVAYPVCISKGELMLLAPNTPNAFVKGAYGIKVPDVDNSCVVSPDEIDFIVVPGLAFDPKCHRLGRGAGYYDRLLKRTTAFKAGFAFDAQILFEVVYNGLDVSMDCVVTPTTIYRK